MGASALLQKDGEKRRRFGSAPSRARSGGASLHHCRAFAQPVWAAAPVQVRPFWEGRGSWRKGCIQTTSSCKG